MIDIYGSPVSNCYNTVLAALRYKQLEHQQHWIPASVDAGFRVKSPMGKIPYIIDNGESISETSAIVEYLNDVSPGPRLFLGTALQRARQRQLMKFVELYVESPARRLFPGVFWCLHNDPVHIDDVQPVIERGLDAVAILLSNNPFLHQQALCAADFYAYFSISLASLVTEKQYGWSILDTYPSIAAYLRKMEGVDFMAEIVEQRDGAMLEYLAKKAAEVE